MTNDTDINSPPHYTAGGLETWEFMLAKMGREEFKGYLLGSIFKYISRAKFKGTFLKDLKKARWFLNLLIQMEEEDAI
jgi:hypothetical protein